MQVEARVAYEPAVDLGMPVRARATCCRRPSTAALTRSQTGIIPLARSLLNKAAQGGIPPVANRLSEN